ncbi:MAG: ABC transporter substrate-binding protein, partial [bacterium]|nr:ABC transporter substrate-binding protein [bacterium]
MRRVQFKRQLAALAFSLAIAVLLLGCEASRQSELAALIKEAEAELAAGQGVPDEPIGGPGLVDLGGEAPIEKDSLKFGFIKLTDCAPIVIAKEKGFFKEQGLQVE